MIHIWVKITGCRSDFFIFTFICIGKFLGMMFTKMFTVVVFSGKIQGEISFWGRKSLKNAVIVWKMAMARSLGDFFTNNPQESASTLVSLLQCSVCDPVLFSVSWWLDSHRLALSNTVWKLSLMCGVECSFPGIQMLCPICIVKGVLSWYYPSFKCDLASAWLWEARAVLCGISSRPT